MDGSNKPQFPEIEVKIAEWGATHDESHEPNTYRPWECVTECKGCIEDNARQPLKEVMQAILESQAFQDYCNGDTSETTMSKLGQALVAPLMPYWGPAPEGSKCSMCKSPNIERSMVMVGGPYTGSVRCKDCQHIASVMSHIAKNCIIVEPLPRSAQPKYKWIDDSEDDQ